MTSTQSEDPKETSTGHDSVIAGIVGERLSLAAFSQLAGNLAGYPFLKIVVDRPRSQIHFINHAVYQFHADYIAEELMGMAPEEMEKEVDRYNKRFYTDPDREYYLAVLSLHKRSDRTFFSLETVEVDTMDADMVTYLFRFVRDNVDRAIPIVLKPANHLQESFMAEIDPAVVPRIMAHELFSSATYIPLNNGTSVGRLRAFRTEADYQDGRGGIEWYDIVVMERVPDDIPRVAGIINALHTTPLSHTNVLASGWAIPNAIQLGIFDRITAEGLDKQWVEYSVDPKATQVGLARASAPANLDAKPAWRTNKIHLESPEITNVPIVRLDQLRHDDRYKYGTKAANLGELYNVLENGSERLLGFYRIRRPPRANLLPYLANFLGVPESADMARAAADYVRSHVKIPQGIAIPFSVQQDFLESSPKIQQAIGKLKMALELNARQIDALCISLQQMIRATRIPERIRNYIDAQISTTLGGVSSFVVRSSSNAEDLEDFSAAGIYESINHVTTAERLFESIKQVWASLLSPRSVRLRQDVGISLDDCYMGVVIQEEMPSTMGGVMVTTNPSNKNDFRNIYLNISAKSVNQVVQGSELPYQYLYNTVEGGGRTLSIGNASADLTEEQKTQLQHLAVIGRLLQSHFSPDYTFAAPVDVEWLAHTEGFSILQLRPYAR